MRSRPPIRIGKWNQLRHFRWAYIKVIDREKMRSQEFEQGSIWSISSPLYLFNLSFTSRVNVRAPIQFRRERQPQYLIGLFFLKNRHIHFHINSTSVIRPLKWNQLSFSRIKINRPLPAPVSNVLQIRFKFRSQFYLLPQIRCMIKIRVESSIISLDTSSKILYIGNNDLLFLQFWHGSNDSKNCSELFSDSKKRKWYSFEKKRF